MPFRKGHTHSPETRAKISAASKGKKQAPEHIAARFAHRDNTVRVSRNDAAMLQIIHRAMTVYQELTDLGTLEKVAELGHVEHIAVEQALNNKFFSLIELGLIWHRGEDVMLAKLAQ